MLDKSIRVMMSTRAHDTYWKTTVDILKYLKAISNRATSTENMVLQWKKKLFATKSTFKKCSGRSKHETNNPKM
jgi:hypothetical protein